MPSLITLKNLASFASVAHSERLQAFCGSVDGDLVLSARPPLAPPAEPRPKKRARDDTEENVDRAIAKLKKSTENVSPEGFDSAKNFLLNFLKIRGPQRENVLESWSVSVRHPGTWGATSSTSLVLAFRLSAGVAVSAHAIVEALKGCSDGMLTTDETKIPPEFKLPLSSQGVESAVHGQSSISVFATVP